MIFFGVNRGKSYCNICSLWETSLGGGGLFSRVAGAWKREHEGDTLPVLSRVSLARLVFLVPITSKRLLRMVGGSEVGEAKREELAVT